MVMKAKWKDCLRGIWKTKSRFLSILCIVMVGVGFFAGVRASSSDMWLSMDTYGDRDNLMHYRVLSTWGFEDADIEAFREQSGTAVQPSYFLDSLIYAADTESAARIYAYNADSDMNVLRLVEGRMPQTAEECLVDAAGGISLDATLEVRGDGTGENDIHDSLERTSYTVVGTFLSPMYISDMERGNTNIGNGQIEHIVYLPIENFKSDYYTEVYLRYEDMTALTAYTDEFVQKEEEHQTDLEDLGAERSQERYDETVGSAQDEISDAEAELESGRAELESGRAELEDAKKEISDGEKEISDGEASLDDGEKEIEENEDSLQSGAEELSARAAELEAAQESLNDAYAEYEAGRQEWEAARAQALQQFEDAKARLDTAKEQLDQAREEIENGQEQYDSAVQSFEEQMSAAQEQIDTQQAQIDAGRAQYESGLRAWQEGYDAYTAGQAQYEEGLLSYNEARAALDAGAQELLEQQAAYDTGKTQYEQLLANIENLQTAYDAAQAAYEADLTALASEKAALDALLEETGEEDPSYLEAKAAYDSHAAQLQETGDSLTAQAAQLETQKAQAAAMEEQLTSAEEQLQAAQEELAQNNATLDAQKAILDQTAETLAETEKTLEENKATLAQSLEQLDSGQTQLDAGQAQLDQRREEAQAELDAAAEELQSGRAEYESGLSEYESGLSEYESQRQSVLTELDAAGAQLDAARDQIESYRTQLRAGQEQIDEARQQLEDGRAQLADAREQIQSGREELADARQNLEEGRGEMADNEQKLEDAEKELADGEQSLEDAKQELADLTAPEWYVYTRDDNPGYEEYGQNAERINNIARVFPAFFVLVAALVCLTTMTRMIEEERTQIGTMKALGYGDGSILAKYMVYALSASLLGCVLGLTIGYQLFPWVVMTAYGMMYSLPLQVRPFWWGNATIITLVCLAAMALTVYLCCRSVLSPMPAQLMRPKAPKKGKKVLLERVPWLWRRLSFSYKITVRNIFRYKRRMFMTIVGIMGCTGLLLTGFGLQDSIGEIIQNQFEKIWLYDTTVAVEDLTESDLGEISDILHEYDPQGSTMQTMQKTYTCTGPSGDMAANLFVAESSEKLSQFIRLENRTSHETFVLEEGGVIITEKLARRLGVSIGDEISVQREGASSVNATVEGIVENYARHYVYILPNTYETLFGETPAYNMVLCLYSGVSAQDEQTMAERINRVEHVLTLQSQSGAMESFSSMLEALDMVIVVLILSAATLAFVVLYNLANINIAERVREIATLEVLGFNDREVSRYVFRESIILTILGTICGLGLGRALTAFVIQTAEIDLVMFGRDVRALSYLWAALMTLAFSCIVSLVMHRPLRKISMVESLKSVE